MSSPALQHHTDVLLAAIQRHVGEKTFTCGQLVHAIAGLGRQAHPELARALGGTSAKSLGWSLKPLLGHVVDGWRLCGEFDRHRNAWNYFFKHVDGLPPGGVELLERAELESRLAAADSPTTKVRELAKRLEQKPAPEPEPEQPKPFTCTWHDRDGALHTEIIRGRDGAPILEKPPEVSKPKPAEPQQGEPDWQAIKGRVLRGQATRHEWQLWQAKRSGRYIPRADIARVSNYSPAPLGFSNPGGVVAQAIHEEMAEGSPVRVTGKWPRFEG